MTFMTYGDGASEVLKSDRLGRVQVPPERRESILDEFERSRMSGVAFARHHRIETRTGWNSLMHRLTARADDHLKATIVSNYLGTK